MHAYQLRPNAPTRTLANRASANPSGAVQGNNGFLTGSDGSDDALPEARVVELPCQEYDGIWES